jgi:hypothetical protein
MIKENNKEVLKKSQKIKKIKQIVCFSYFPCVFSIANLKKENIRTLRRNNEKTGHFIRCFFTGIAELMCFAVSLSAK